MAHDRVCIVLVAAPDRETAERLGEAVVTDRLAACASIVPGMKSIYRWQGEIHRDEEALVIIKAPTRGFGAIRTRIAELHPYDTPEILALDVDDGDPAYLRWVVETTGGRG
jgi:periplasmic divalent cation tolerance protein